MADPKATDPSDVSRETSERLSILAAHVRKWNPAINLVARSTLDDLEGRHIADSLQLVDCAPTQVAHWVDLGSGGGFPGLVIAAVMAERAPDMALSLVESDQRKCVFLRSALQAMGLRAQVLAARIETLAPQKADVLSARALAPLDRLCGFAERHLQPSGVAIFPKGERWEEEVAIARRSWNFDLETRPSSVDEKARILLVRNPRRVVPA